LNQVLSDTNALGESRLYRYHALGNLITYTDRNDRTRQFSFDTLDRQTTEQWLDGNGNTLQTIAIDYDAAGQVLSITGKDSQYSYGYDAAGRLIQVDNAGTVNTPNVVLNYSYDAVNNVTAVTDTIAGQLKGTKTLTYDVLNRTTQITQSGNGVSEKRINMAYDAIGQITQLNRYAALDGNAIVAQSDYIYDSTGRLIRLTHQNGNTTYADYQWTYDQANRITQFISPDGTNIYSYNNRSELTGAESTYQSDEAYSYDASGNRTNTGYQTGANNRLLSDGTYRYEYDAEGNRTKRVDLRSGEVTDYFWNYYNQLTDVVTKNSNGEVTRAIEYSYDAWGRRIGKVIDIDGAGSGVAQRESYVYEGDDVAIVFDGNGVQLHRYLYGPAVDQILADENSTSVNWALVDNLGSLRDIVDRDGVLLNHVTYDSFGQVTSELNLDVDFRFGYTGRKRDEETGLYYYRARYYDAAVGEFVSEDPIGFNAGDYNLTRYVAGNPVNGIDPYGLFVENPELIRQFQQVAQQATQQGSQAASTVTSSGSTLFKVGGGILTAVGGELLFPRPVADATVEGMRKRLEKQKQKNPFFSGIPEPTTISVPQVSALLHEF
jgi:RHS repeat-associated protein